MVKIDERALDRITEIAIRRFDRLSTPRLRTIIEALEEYIIQKNGAPGFELTPIDNTPHTPVEE